MLAATYRRYGPPSVLRVTDVPKPRPKPNEVLVRVHASTVCSADARIRAMRLPDPIFIAFARLALGVRRPRNPVPGTELSGTVEAVGTRVHNFKPGDHVLASTGLNMGANAQYAVVRCDRAIAHKPASLTFEQAAAIPFGGCTALHFLRKANLRPNQRILINGASGSLGTHAIQLAKHTGAHVTAVCSAKNHALARELGADDTIDYTTTPLPTLQAQPFNAIFDAVGTADFRAVRHLLTPDGRFLAAVMTTTEILQSIYTPWLGKQRVIGGVSTETPQDLAHLASLAEQGHLRPVVSQTFPLADIAAAHALADSGRKVGQIVITIPTPQP